jgi:hypothetical protein
MKLFLFPVVAALALVGTVIPVGAVKGSARSDVVPARGQEDRMLGRKKSTRVSNCCDLIKKILELDQACKAIVASAEQTSVCVNDFNILPTGKGKGGSSTPPEVQLAAARAAFDAFILSFQTGLFSPVTQTTCFPAGALPVPLVSYGDWCASSTITGGVVTYTPIAPVADLGVFIAAL